MSIFFPLLQLKWQCHRRHGATDCRSAWLLFGYKKKQNIHNIFAPCGISSTFELFFFSLYLCLLLSSFCLSIVFVCEWLFTISFTQNTIFFICCVKVILGLMQDVRLYSFNRYHFDSLSFSALLIMLLIPFSYVTLNSVLELVMVRVCAYLYVFAISHSPSHPKYCHCQCDKNFVFICSLNLSNRR